MSSAQDTGGSDAFPSRPEAPAILVRALITDEEWRALNAAVARTGADVGTIVGWLISEYLWANGYMDSAAPGAADGT
jgi:hypothetical protein